MGPKISLAHPNYNHAHLLEQSIEGVLAQTYPNWELVVVDDGSTDGSWTLLENYARKDARIRIERFGENRGIAAAVAHGMTFCTGELFYPRASDVPIVSPRFFERAVKGLEKHPQAAVIFGQTHGTDAQGNVLANGKWGWPAEPNEYVSPEQAVREFFLSDYVAGESTILNREQLLSQGAYDTELGPWQDLYVNEALIALHGGIYIDEVVTHCQMDANSYSRRQSVKAMTEFAARMEKKFRALPLKIAPRREWIIHYRERKLTQALLHREQLSLADTLGQLAANLGGWPQNRQPRYMSSLLATLQSMSGVVRTELQSTTNEMLALYDSIAGPIPAE